MNKPVVSICVPIYGVEKYIARCAKSLFEQTYPNIEFIFINDCTKDRSIDILQDVICHYPNKKGLVKIINHERNRGLAAARNTGIENAHGEFVLWVDSDDYVDDSLVAKLVLKQAENDADIVCSDVQILYGYKTEIYRNTYENDPRKFIRNIFLGKQQHWVWGKLIRKSIYTEYNILAEEGCNMAEDFQVLPKLAYYSLRIDYVKEPLCFYEQANNTSYTKKINEIQQMQKWRSYDIVYVFFRETNLREDLDFSAADMVYFHLKTYYLKDGLSKDYFLMLKARWKDIPFSAKMKLPLKKFIFIQVGFIFEIGLLKKGFAMIKRGVSK